VKCRYTRDVDAGPDCPVELVTLKNGRRVIAAGTIVDQAEHPITRPAHDVRSGIAIPLDDECREACGRTPEQIQAAQRAVERLYAPPITSGDGDNDDDE